MKKSNLRATAALRALALLGAGIPVAFIAAAPAAAQDYTRGVLVGTVTDEGGTPIAGAEVTVRNNQQGYQTTTITDANGRFSAVALATGTYTVIVRKADQVLVEDRAVNVVAGQTNTYGYTAGGPAIAGAGADQQRDTGGTIVVTGRRIQVDDFATTQTGANIDVAQVASTVPVGRDQTSLILLAPGTTQGDLGFGNLASISGATVAENAYYVNGLNITDFRNFLGGSLIPFEFYRTLDVKTGGYQAEYGRALGGVTSAVTKSGSNEIAGGAVVAYAPDWGRSDSPNTYAALNQADERTSVDGNFYLSGPLIKDRVFLYGLYSPRYFNVSDTSIVGRQRIRTSSDSPFWGLKADAIILPGHRIEGTMWSDKQTQRTTYQRYIDADVEDDQVGTLGDLQGTFVSNHGGRSWIGTYTGQFTDFFTLSGSYGINKNVNTGAPSPNTDYATSSIACPGGVCGASTTTLVAGFRPAIFDDVNKREFYRADADLYLNFFGKHHFRAGIDNETLTAVENTRYAGTGYTYSFVRTPPRLGSRYQVNRRLYRNAGNFETKMSAMYIQDAWSLWDDRVNVQAGLRNDKFKNYTVAGEKYYDSGSNWAPRLGLTFDVFGDKRTKLNAFYGKYYLPIATNTNIRLGGAELYYQQTMDLGTSITDLNGDRIPDQFSVDAAGNVIGFTANNGGATCPAVGPDAGAQCSAIYSDGVPGGTDTLVAQGLKPSESDEYILGLSHRFGDGWSAGVDYVRRRVGETLEDVAIDKAVWAYCEREGIEGCEFTFYGFHQYVLANPGSDITVRLDGGARCTETVYGRGPDPELCEVVTLSAADLGYPKAVRKYDAIQFTLDKAFNGFWGANFNYVYTKLRGNFEGGVKSDNNQTDTGLTQDFDQPGFLEGAYGDLANGRKHAFKFFGHVKPLPWLDVGVNAILESPRKFSCIGQYRNRPRFSETGMVFPEAWYGAASYWCQQERFANDNAGVSERGSYLVPRSTAFKSQWNRQIDLGLGFDLGVLGEPLNGSQFRIDVFNIFNFKQKLDFNEFGDISFAGPNPNYGKVLGYQAPRSIRFSLAMRFGESR